MSDIPEFTPFPKMARLSREVIITEKIDGTNACILITEDGGFYTGSRTRWITPQDDNFGFARWAMDHKDDLMQLGPGRHFGEWWGSGIQRGYGLTKGEKRFSLFNVARWVEDHGGEFRAPLGVMSQPDPTQPPKYQQYAPACCHVVPVLNIGMFDTDSVDYELNWLSRNGSKAAPGFMNPEGVVCFHTAGNFGFKKTIKGDESPKSATK